MDIKYDKSAKSCKITPNYDNLRKNFNTINEKERQ